MTKSPRIDRINLRNNRFGVMGIVYSDRCAYAVRFAPNTRVIICENCAEGVGHRHLHGTNCNP